MNSYFDNLKQKISLSSSIYQLLYNIDRTHCFEKLSPSPFHIKNFYLVSVYNILDNQMQNDLASSPPGYNYKVTKVRDDRTSPSTLLVVGRHQSPSSDEDNWQENSTYQMRKSQKQKTLEQDYVELPKINFANVQYHGKDRKNSAVNIELPDIDEEADRKGTLNIPASEHDSDYLSSNSEENEEEYKQWDIKNINIANTKDKDNYLPSDYELLPESVKEKKKRDRKSSRNLEREMERRERQRNLEMVSNFLSGKASVVWLFVLGKDTPAEEVDKVRHIYREYQDQDYEIPLCRSYEEALKFFSLANCFFKVVVDLQNSPRFLEETQPNKNVVSIYIYNPLQLEGINRAFEMKKNLKKIKGMYNSLDEVTKQAEVEIDNEARFVKVGDDIEREKNNLRFPSFITLTGADSSEVTNYRLCLFGAIKLKERRQREPYLKEFTQMVELRYKGVQKQLQNLREYMKIDHLTDNSQQKMTEVLKFYVKETFYYVLTNSVLRLSRSAEEFRPCTIPFNQTYHAIKHYYQKYRQDGRNAHRKMVVYRGAKLRNSDVKTLTVGSYIQLLGFTSTSLKRSEAEKFMDGDSFLIEIHIDRGAENQHEFTFDHGFVEINRYNLAAKAFQKEEEVLINALNVFKVTAIDVKSATRKITIQYGAILPLLRTKDKELSSSDRAVVQNYKFSLQTFNNIEDDGDVLLIAQEHDRCIQYYQAKVDRGEEDFKTYCKLAHAQLQSGDIEQAYTNALRSLQRLQHKSRDDEEIKKTVIQLKKNVDVFQMREDYLHYHNSIDICLKMLKDDWLESVRLLKQKAEKKLSSGDLSGCEEDLKMARAVMADKTKSFDLRRRQVEKRYYIRSLCCACTQSASSQLFQQKELEMLKIQQDELQFQRKKEEIHQVSIQIENLAKEVAEERHDEEEYRRCVESSQKHFLEMEKESLNPVEEAKYQALEASVVDKHEHLPDFQSKMEEAIKTVKKHDPMHADVGTYCNALGTERQVALKRKMLLTPIVPRSGSSVSNNLLAPPNQPLEYIPIGEEHPVQKFNYQQHKIMVTRCKQNLIQAAENIAYNSGKENPVYLSVRNKLTELDFDSSKLLQSQRLAIQTKDFKLVRLHSQGARCYLLLTKISLAKGQLKSAFENVEQSLQILRNTLVKVDNKEYNTILVNNPLYIQINLHRAKIFNRQLKHQMALKELKILKKVAEIRRNKHHSSSILASVFEEEAQIELCNGQTDQFEEKILEAISIREIEMGKYNILNAIAYSNLFKFMLNLNDMETAMTYHLKATEIFSRFPTDHPNFWVIHLSNAMIYFKRDETEKCLDQLQNCQRVTNYRYSQNHIITLKVEFQYGQMMKKMSKIPKAIELFKQCEDVIVRSLKERANHGQKLQKETDDQKFPLLKNVYRQMQDLHEVEREESNQRDLSAVLEVQKYKQHLAEIQQMLVSSSTAELHER